MSAHRYAVFGMNPDGWTLILDCSISGDGMLAAEMHGEQALEKAAFWGVNPDTLMIADIDSPYWNRFYKSHNRAVERLMEEYQNEHS